MLISSESIMVNKHTTCKTRTCRRWKNLNPDGFCSGCQPAIAVDEDTTPCSHCKETFSEEDEDSNTIGCDLCKSWYHINCIGSDELSAIVNDPENSKITLGELRWFCPSCNDKLKDWIEVSTACTTTNNGNVIHPEPSHATQVLCADYKRGCCPHGISGKHKVNGLVCQNSHPKPCKRFMKNGPNSRYGCKLGDQCTHFHPILCRNSVQKHLCLNLTCTFMHIKGTKRTKVPSHTRNSGNFITNSTGRGQPKRSFPGSLSAPFSSNQDNTHFSGPVLPNRNQYWPTGNENHFLVSMMNQMQKIQESVTILESRISGQPSHQNTQIQWGSQLPSQKSSPIPLDPRNFPLLANQNPIGHQSY